LDKYFLVVSNVMTTKQISHENNNRNQTRENGFGSNKGRNVNMALIAGIGLAIMLAASSSMISQKAFASDVDIPDPNTDGISAEPLDMCEKILVVCVNGIVAPQDKDGGVMWSHSTIINWDEIYGGGLVTTGGNDDDRTSP
jgi:hypothetical protein